MRTLTLALILAIALGATYSTVDAQSAPQAQRITPTIEGSWSIGFPNEDPTSRQLASFLPGGVALSTNAPTFEEEELGGRVYATAGHGAWAALGGGRYAFTIVFLYFSGDEENVVSVTIEGVVTLDASGDSFRGTYTFAVASADGTPIFSAEAEPLTGTRIRPPVR